MEVSKRQERKRKSKTQNMELLEVTRQYSMRGMELDMNTTIPWLLALATTIWFVLMAFRAKQGVIAWGVAGAILGLVTATIIMGLGNAAHIPMSEASAQSFKIKSALLSAVVILGLGWLFSMSLHRHHLVIWRAAKRVAGQETP